MAGTGGIGSPREGCHPSSECPSFEGRPDGRPSNGKSHGMFAAAAANEFVRAKASSQTVVGAVDPAR